MSKNNFKCNVMVVGLYFSGSSAVTDLLQEYEGVGVVPGEFDDFRRVGMVGDHIQGKIGDDYLCNISNVKHNMGNWIPRYCNSKANIKNIIKYLITITPLKSIYKKGLYEKLSIRLGLLDEVNKALLKSGSKKQKLDAGKKWLSKVSALYAGSKPYTLFDQPIFLNAHKDVWPEMFDPFKLIVVYRDPRDQIAQLIKQKILFFDMETPTRSLIEIYGDDRLGAIRFELDALQARFRNAVSLQKTHGKDKVKIISFESLVTNYDKEKEGIEKFLELAPGSHIKKKQFLNPAVSCKNIGLYKNYLTES